ncbi:MAG: sugar O-acetyltransferase [Clostridia bacterium]|nr:sugar O-acetyltransferase [Clostridia bacterium]
MREEEKIFAGQFYNPGHPDLTAMKLRCHNLCHDFNNTYENEREKRAALLKEIFAEIGEGSSANGPITIHYGCHTTMGKNVFCNFNLTIQDDGKVTIGDRVNFGPNVTIVTPQHPLLPDERSFLKTKDGRTLRLCYAEPVTIGNDCWFGANVVVCPGVTIGNNCVIGAGSVVTKDIPDNSIAVGNPCRVLRTLSDADSMRHRPELFGDEEFVFD